MQRTLVRGISVGAAAVVVMAVASGAAFAAHGHGRFGAFNVFRARSSSNGGGMPGGGGGFGFGRGGGQGGPGFGGGQGGSGGGQGGPGGGGGVGVLGTDVLTPAASFLGISASTLESDLAGGKTLAQEATAKGKTAADLITALVASEKTILDGDQAAGWITADQETSLLTGFTNEITDLVNNGPGVPPSGGQTPSGPLQTAATFLGISVSTLQSDLKGGESLADVTTGAGKTVADLVTALEAPVQANLDAAVTAGKITQAQETAILNRMTTQLTNFANGTASQSQSNTVKKNLKEYSTLKSFGKKHR